MPTRIASYNLVVRTQGDPLGIHDPSEAELGGISADQDGRFVKRSRKILRGIFLMVIISFCWVCFVHLLRMSFHTDRLLLQISPITSSLNRIRNLRQANNMSAPLLLPTSTTTASPAFIPGLPPNNTIKKVNSFYQKS